MPRVHSRRGLFRAGAVGGAAAVLAATVGGGRAGAAEPVSIDTSFADFAVPQINGGDDSLAKIQKKGVIVVGTSNDWPYSFLDPEKNNAWSGLDAEIITFACKMLNIPKIDVQTVTFDGLIPGTLGGRFDLVGDSIHYTKARSKVVNFCFPTYYYAEALAVPKGNPLKLRSLADLKGHTAGTLLGTNYAEWLQSVPGVTMQGYKDWQQMMPELALGRLDAVLYDQPVVAAQMTSHPEWKVEMVEDYEPRTFKNPAGYSSYAFRPGDIQLVTAMSAAIAWMEYNLEMKKILTKWGLTGYNN
ncbi:MAG TPA: transporter substrate-binding domain-containing protein [Stellaceae bacterium]|nr:transporter substrate-binding domain-containing protein [Stellaceae bacterium]